MALGGVAGMQRPPSKDHDPAALAEAALDSGITYFDTAPAYNNGQSERNYGEVLARRRKEVFLATKTGDRTYDGTMRSVEQSLKRLRTDRVDLLQIHGANRTEDLSAWGKRSAVLAALHKLRDQKVTRFIGMTSHTDGAVMAKAIERNDLDCVQMAMNPARASRFEELALPAANKKNLGVILMKVTGQEKLLVNDGADAASLLRYAWSLPITTAVCGMPKLEYLDANVKTASAFSSPLPPAEVEALRKKLAGRQIVLEDFFAHHHDGGWTA